MKKHKLFLPLLLVFIVSGFVEKHAGQVTAGKWTGTVSFFEKKTGPKIVISEWKMDAMINDDVCHVIHSYKFENTDGDTVHCRNEEDTELEVVIEKDEGKYFISVRVPGCSGVTDETAIVINDQPLPDDPKVLVGQLLLRDGPDANGDESKTTYTWNLEKDKKKNNPTPP